MDIKSIASINQTSKHPLSTTEVYSFIPTSRVLEILAGHGWHPVKAQEMRVRKPENHGYQRHLVRLGNEQFGRELPGVGEVLPEIALINSHGGTSSFQLYVALLEKVCGNGLLVERETASHFRIEHTGYTDGKVAATIAGVMRSFPEVLSRREEMKAIAMPPDARIAFAREAAGLRFGDRAEAAAASDLLRARHPGQAEPTLWNTFNVVQENAIRGGVRSRGRNGRTLRSRPIRGVGESTRLNRALWLLAERAAQELS
jgi:hypothetical protein